MPEDENRFFAAFLKRKVWPADTYITFAYKSGQHANITQLVLTTFNPILETVKFVHIENYDEAIVRIDFEPYLGSWSYIGTDCQRVPKDRCTMNLEFEDERTVLHEFCHVLGMVHEHQNPRANSLKIDHDKLYVWCKTAYGWSRERTFNNILRPYAQEQLNGSEFDAHSIMLYHFPKILLIDETEVSDEEPSTLSVNDVEWIRITYKSNDEIDARDVLTV